MPTWNGRIPALHEAAANGYIDEINRLLNGGVDKDMLDANGNTALHWAAKYAQTSTLLALIQAGAKLNVCNEKGYTPLKTAVENSQEYDKIARILREAMEKQGG